MNRNASQLLRPSHFITQSFGKFDKSDTTLLKERQTGSEAAGIYPAYSITLTGRGETFTGDKYKEEVTSFKNHPSCSQRAAASHLHEVRSIPSARFKDDP